MVKPLKPPHYAKDAIPTLRGWVRRGELIVSRRHTQSQIDQYMNSLKPQVKAPEPQPVVEQKEPEVQPITLTESPVNEDQYRLEHMTKAELAEFADQHGIEVDTSARKDQMIAFLKESLN